MKSLVSAVLILLATGVLSGCVQDNTVVHVRPDGSGTIEETVLLSNDMLEFMESFSPVVADDTSGQEQRQGGKEATKEEGASTEPKKKTRDDVIADMAKEAEKKAALFGPAVKFVSAKPVQTETAGGYRALYAFADINQVKINQNPSDKVAGPAAGSDAPSKKEEFVQFKFTKGSPSRLIITFPERKDKAQDPSGEPADGKQERQDKKPDAQSLEMMKAFFKDMRLSISLTFEKTIVKTNASYRDGLRITLMEMDFGKIVGDPELFGRITAVNPQSLEETKALLKGVEGLKLELNNPVIVEFN